MKGTSASKNETRNTNTKAGNFEKNPSTSILIKDLFIFKTLQLGSCFNLNWNHSVKHIIEEGMKLEPSKN